MQDAGGETEKGDKDDVVERGTVTEIQRQRVLRECP